MKLIQFLCVCLAISAISAQASQLELLQVINLARSDPKVVAGWIKLKYLDQNKHGVSGDENCYKEAYDWLMAAPTVNGIVEDAGLDVAAYSHAKNQVENQLFRHNMSDETSPTANVRKYGRFEGQWKITQLVAQFQRSTAVPANDIVMLFASDCGISSRKHRTTLFSNDFKAVGAGIHNKERKTIATVIFGTGFIRNPLTNQQLTEAMIEGNGKYSGAGKSHETATFKTYGQFTHDGAQVHTKDSIESFDDSNGPLGTLKDDGSVKCPTKINSEVLELSTVRGWTKTSQHCERGKDAFTTADHLDRVIPFAQNGKCYHRFRFCAASGAVYTYDRQYKTEQQLSIPVHDIKNELGDGHSDQSVKCPEWINNNLRTRVVNNWYIFDDKNKCTRGTDYNTSTGLKRVVPFAKLGRCYQRLLYCHTDGIVWAKDSEYKTYAQWASLLTK